MKTVEIRHHYLSLLALKLSPFNFSKYQHETNTANYCDKNECRCSRVPTQMKDENSHIAVRCTGPAIVQFNVEKIPPRQYLQGTSGIPRKCYIPKIRF